MKQSGRFEVNDGVSTIAGGGGEFTSGTIPAYHGTPFSLIWIITTAGSADMTFEYQFSEDGVTFSDDIRAFGATGASSEGDANNATGQKNGHNLSWVEAPFYRVKITNNDATAATCLCKLNLNEDVAR